MRKEMHTYAQGPASAVFFPHIRYGHVRNQNCHTTAQSPSPSGRRPCRRKDRRISPHLSLASFCSRLQHHLNHHHHPFGSTTSDQSTTTTHRALSNTPASPTSIFPKYALPNERDYSSSQILFSPTTHRQRGPSSITWSAAVRALYIHSFSSQFQRNIGTAAPSTYRFL
jgi:hypothetical protein